MSPRKVCVVLHDVSPATWGACKRLLDAVDGFGRIPVTLLVVPEYHHRASIGASPEFVHAIERRLALGDEVAMHGYFHRDEAGLKSWSPADRFRRTIWTAREGEFSALDATAAAQRLAHGLSQFDRLGWKVAGFVPPAWLLGPGGRTALAASGFRYTSTRTHLVTLPDGRSYASPSLVWSVRSHLRRRLSATFNTYLRHRLRNSPLMRLGLHAADAAHPDAMRFWLGTLRECLDSRLPVTKSEWLGLSP
ncbi:MAG: polysaccharide deacetylase family protein [Betaproteobacteria bacterium]|nr:polysaccharide deacetylase family protein [Betaproteobacteria bacterium]